jgi:hypothetical protein
MLRIEGCGLAKRSFCFEVPETVKLDDSLVKKTLSHWVLGGYFPVKISHARHEVRCLTRPLIKGVRM